MFLVAFNPTSSSSSFSLLLIYGGGGGTSTNKQKTHRRDRDIITDTLKTGNHKLFLPCFDVRSGIAAAAVAVAVHIDAGVW